MLTIRLSGATIQIHYPVLLALSLTSLIPVLLWRRARRAYNKVSARLGGLGSPPGFPVLLVLAIILLSVAASSPTIRQYKSVSIESASINTVQRIPISLVICLDVSKSMGYRDSGSKRIDMAKSFVEKLVTRIGRARVVILAFSHAARLVYEGPPGNASRVLGSIVAGERYSAIGDAIASAASYIRASGLPGAVIAVTDGGWNYGADPVQVARELRAQHIPVVFVIVGHDPRGAGLAERLREQGISVYYLNEVSYKAIDSLVEKVSKSARLEALRLAGITSIRLPIGERDVSWITGLLAISLLVARFVLET